MRVTIASRIGRWFQQAVGEISKLRSSGGFGLIGGSIGAGFKLNSDRVDYTKARGLYENTDDDYKLGAGFAKPVINTTVGFMGVPQFRSEDENAQTVLDDFFGANTSRMQQTHRDALRDGDAYVWITREEESDAELYPEKPARLVYNMIPPEQVTDIICDPTTRAPIEYVLTSQHEWTDEGGNKRRAKVEQRIGAGYRKVKIDGDTPLALTAGDQATPWKFIPIVHFKNDPDASRKHGVSEMESIEPFLKAYHEVMKAAISGSKLHSTPRLKLKLKSVESFLANNFGITDPVKFLQEGKTINLDGHELLIFADETEDGAFIEAQSPTGAAEPLLKLLFYCIVDTSETPEFVFGVHTPSSLSSVQEQMPIVVRKVGRKREQFTEPWQRLARITLAMTAQAEGGKFSTYATTLDWDEVNPKDEVKAAETLERTVNALNLAVTGGLMSLEAAVNYLATMVDTMNDWLSDDPEVPGERERILQSRILLARLEDAGLSDQEREALSKATGAQPASQEDDAGGKPAVSSNAA